MEPEPPEQLFLLLALAWNANIALAVLGIVLLIVCSALVSGSEVAFFSITPSDMQELDEDKSAPADRLRYLRKYPQKLLATILIANNLINILIIIISDYLLRELLPDETFRGIAESITSVINLDILLVERSLNFFVTVIGVTFLLVLFGELLPKIYANLHHMRLARFMSRPLKGMMTVFSPFSNVLVGWSDRMEKRLGRNTATDQTLKDDLEQAIEFSVDKDIYHTDEGDLLKGIINFGDVMVKQIMKSRVDIIAIDEEAAFDELMKIVLDSGFSRIPVYKENLDSINGILYVKDLLGYTTQSNDFKWQNLVREENIIYVPETKNIDDLLREFQHKHLHLAIAVDEFGGTSGLVTLEDIMEEIIGEIQDEFDDDEIDFQKIDDSTYLFDGKVLLNDVCRIIDSNLDEFDQVKGNSDSLAGLILEINGTIPRKNEVIVFKQYEFHIEDVDKRRIKEVKIQINEVMD